MGEKINIALIGYGNWGRVWEKVLKNQNTFNFKYIYTPRVKNKGLFTNNIDKVLMGDIDSVIICTPVNTHFDIVKMFLTNRKHVLCEKPLTINYNQALKLKSLAKQNKVVLETNYSYLHSPSINLIKKNLFDIGEVYAMESYIDGFGKFYKGEDVYSVHSPHIITVVLDLFPEYNFNIKTKNLVYSKENTVDVGYIFLESDYFKSIIHSSLRSIKKERKIVLFGSKGVIEYNATSTEQFKLKMYHENEHELLEKKSIFCELDETKNLDKTLLKFHDVIKNRKTSNLELSIRTTRLLEEITPAFKQ